HSTPIAFGKRGQMGGEPVSRTLRGTSDFACGESGTTDWSLRQRTGGVGHVQFLDSEYNARIGATAAPSPKSAPGAIAAAAGPHLWLQDHWIRLRLGEC